MRVLTRKMESMPEAETCVERDRLEAGLSSMAIARPAMERDVTRLAGGAGASLGGKLAGRGIHMLVDIVLAHLLGPADFGLYAIAYTVSRLLGLIAPLGLGSGVLRFGTRDRDDEARLKGTIIESLGASVASGLVLGGVLFLAAPWMAEHIFQKPDAALPLRWLAFMVPLLSGLNVAAAATRISQRMKFSVYAEEISQPVVNLLLFFILYALGRGLSGALQACVYSFGFAAALGLYYVGRLFPEAVSRRTKASFPGMDLMSFSTSVWLGGIFILCIIWMDRLIIGHFRPAAEVGVYYAASQLSVSFVIILGGFASMFSPMAVELYHKGEIRRLQEVFRVSTKWALYMSLPPCLVMCLAPRQVMGGVFGSRYESGWPALVILALGQLINAGTGPSDALLVMTGGQGAWFKISGAMFVLSFTLAWILVPRLGLTGAAIATASAVSLTYLATVFVIRRRLGIWPYDRKYFKGLLAAAGAAAAVLVLGRVNLGRPLVNLIGLAIISAGVFATLMLGLGLDGEDRQFIGWFRTFLARARGAAVPEAGTMRAEP